MKHLLAFAAIVCLCVCSTLCSASFMERVEHSTVPNHHDGDVESDQYWEVDGAVDMDDTSNQSLSLKRKEYRQHRLERRKSVHAMSQLAMGFHGHTSGSKPVSEGQPNLGLRSGEREENDRHGGDSLASNAKESLSSPRQPRGSTATASSTEVASSSGKCELLHSIGLAMHNLTAELKAQAKSNAKEWMDAATVLRKTKGILSSVKKPACEGIEKAIVPASEAAYIAASFFGENDQGLRWMQYASEVRDMKYSKAVCWSMKLMRALCAWDGIERYGSAMHKLIDDQLASREFACVGPFFLQQMPDNIVSPRQLFEMEKLFSKKPMASPKFPPFQRPVNASKIRVGFLSFDFARHPLGFLMQSVFSFMDKQRFDVFCYSTRESDDSDIRKKIEHNCQHFIQFRPNAGDEFIANKIHHDRIDVLFDLGGYTLGNKQQALAQRPSRTIVSFLGWAGSTGSNYTDYIITDKVAVPPEIARSDFTEKPVYMPFSYFVTDHRQSAPLEQLAKAPKPDRSFFGSKAVKNDTFIFANFNNLYKIDPETFGLWAQILKQVPNSVMWLLESPASAKAHLLAKAESMGLTDRFVFTKRFPKDARYYNGLALADLYIDTLTVNGHTVVTDTLWGGVPVITKPSHKLFSRVAASLLHATGLDDFVVHSNEAYVSMAVSFAKDKEKLQRARKRIEDSRATSPLFDTKRWTKDLEVAIEHMYKLDQPAEIDLSDREEHHHEGTISSSASASSSSSSFSSSSSSTGSFDEGTEGI